MIIVKRPDASLVVCMFILIISNEVRGFHIPFFGSYWNNGQTATTLPAEYPHAELKQARIINAEHGPASIAGGNPSGSASQWISGTRDQFMRDQLAFLHPDSALNTEAWQESGYLTSQFEPGKQIQTPSASLNNNLKDSNKIVYNNNNPTQSPPRVRKVPRKSKQNQSSSAAPGNKVTSSTTVSPAAASNVAPSSEPVQQHLHGQGLYEIPAPPQQIFLRDILSSSSASEQMLAPENLYFHGNNMVYSPGNSYHHQPYLHYSPRATSSQHSALPPEAIIQFLQSPEEELSQLTRPQIKLPFPLRHSCSSGGGSGGSNKPLQFVVLPIVEPVAPLKPSFPKPSFLPSQYGQFPYIPPFNLFNKRPSPVATQSNANNNGGEGVSYSGGSSGQFVPILNRPAPPLPFVFVQSLPLELIGQNMEMDVLHASSAPESKIREPPPQPQVSAPISVPQVEAIPKTPNRPVPLIVIEKVKTPGAPPPPSPSSSAGVPPGVLPAAAVEITKQSIQKNSASPPVSTISVVQPVGGPQHSEEIHKAIQKLVPVAAAVLENVEKQEKEQKKDIETSITAKKNAISNVEADVPTPAAVVTNEQSTKAGELTKPVGDTVSNDQSKAPLRAPLRPDNTPQETTVHKKPDSSSSEEVMTGSTPTFLNDTVITVE